MQFVSPAGQENGERYIKQYALVLLHDVTCLFQTGLKNLSEGFKKGYCREVLLSIVHNLIYVFLQSFHLPLKSTLRQTNASLSLRRCRFGRNELIIISICVLVDWCDALQLILLSLSQFATPLIIYKIWTDLGGTAEGFFSFFRH